ncbi:MAG: hypothetical protein JWP91_2767 [Fibrobacteres bacterium]|nr:hypothetical protein [Fibrobacterota bacterium]
MEHIIAESNFDMPLSEEAEHEGAQAIDRSLTASGGHWIRSFYSKDRKRIVCEFEASGVDAVRTAYESAGFPLDQVWPAEVYAGESLKAE